MAENYRHPGDCSIERGADALQDKVADLYDCDGEKVWTFPVDMSDAQIMVALAFANHAFRKGIELGELRKVQSIKAVLGIA